MKEKLVIDTNVLVSALWSKRGASYRLMSLLGTDRFEMVLSAALVYEYEDVIKRDLRHIPLTQGEVDELLDGLCAAALRQNIYFLWRPQLKDPSDEHLLELAIAANCSCIITYNSKDLRPAKQFGIQVLTPKEYLQRIGELS